MAADLLATSTIASCLAFYGGRLEVVLQSDLPDFLLGEFKLAIGCDQLHFVWKLVSAYFFGLKQIDAGRLCGNVEVPRPESFFLQAVRRDVSFNGI